jgi:hypothetical protein
MLPAYVSCLLDSPSGQQHNAYAFCGSLYPSRFKGENRKTGGSTWNA